jgi:hypothetical protein
VRTKEDAYVADVNSVKVFAAKLNLVILYAVVFNLGYTTC